MNVLITAGGTREDIDSVRSIANKSTGRLGSIIADTFAQGDWHVTYVCGERAVLPDCRCLELIRIQNVSELIMVMETLLKRRLYDCVIHSMAVSDFTPQGIIFIDDIAEAISRALQEEQVSYKEMPDKIRAVIAGREKPLTNKKIDSTAHNSALLLKQTPKVIGRIKEIQPQTLLVGFKLLSDVTEAELIKAGLRLLKKNDCDFVVANDLSDIYGDTHKAILLNKDGILGRGDTKKEIGDIIFNYVSERVAGI